MYSVDTRIYGIYCVRRLCHKRIHTNDTHCLCALYQLVSAAQVFAAKYFLVEKPKSIEISTDMWLFGCDNVIIEKRNEFHSQFISTRQNNISVSLDQFTAFKKLGSGGNLFEIQLW